MHPLESDWPFSADLCRGQAPDLRATQNPFMDFILRDKAQILAHNMLLLPALTFLYLMILALTKAVDNALLSSKAGGRALKIGFNHNYSVILLLEYKTT